jgi:hypothetical protein
MADKFNLFEARVRREKERQRTGDLGNQLYSAGQAVPAEQMPPPAAPQPDGSSASAAGDKTAQPADEGRADTTAYGFVRGITERASDLRFEKLDGSSPSLGYSWLFTRIIGRRATAKAGAR